jgi:uncharacterized membrane protein YraQ (UPF0718 family)
MIKKYLKRYSFSLAAIAVLVTVMTVSADTGRKALDTTLYSFQEMALVIPPVFVLLGLLDVWVPREMMIRFMGEGSGLKGALLAVLVGTAAAGPLYAAFPVAAVMMKKGAKFTNVLLFIGAWSTTKVPMVAFEVASMGPLFAFTRLGLSLIGITLIALITEKAMKKEEVELIYERAEKL